MVAGEPSRRPGLRHRAGSTVFVVASAGTLTWLFAAAVLTKLSSPDSTRLLFERGLDVEPGTAARLAAVLLIAEVSRLALPFVAARPATWLAIGAMLLLVMATGLFWLHSRGFGDAACTCGAHRTTVLGAAWRNVVLAMTCALSSWTLRDRCPDQASGIPRWRAVAALVVIASIGWSAFRAARAPEVLTSTVSPPQGRYECRWVTVAIRNDSSRTAVLHRVVPSCTCVQTTASDSKLLEPGRETTLTVWEQSDDGGADPPWHADLVVEFTVGGDARKMRVSLW